MKPRAICAVALVLVSGSIFLLSACAPGGGGGTMMSAVPDGDYQAVVSFKPNAFLKAGFITKLKENFPMAGMMFAEMEKQPEESGIKIDQVDTVMAFTSTDGENLMLMSGSFDPKKAREEFQKNQGLTLAEKTESGHTYYVDDNAGMGLMFNGNVGIQANEAGLKKVIGVLAGSGKKFVDGENFKKAAHLMDANSTVSFATLNSTEMDASMMAMQLGQIETDQAKVDMLVGAFGKMQAIAGNFTVTDSINGRLSMVFGDAAAAKSVSDYMNDKKGFIFEKMADQFEEMAAMMPGINVDREKIKGLANSLSFSAEGAVMHAGLKLGWNDIAFLFEKK